MFCSILFVLLVGVAVANPLTGRITHGEEAKDGDAPFMVRVYAYRGDGVYTVCGGSIIHKKYVLTAAHCLDGKDAEDVSIEYNTLKKNGGDTARAEKVWVHSKYDSHPFVYDIALIKLNKKLKLGQTNAEKISLPEKDAKMEKDSEVTIFGWGKDEDGDSPDELQKVQTKVVGHEKCQEVYGKDAIISKLFCAGDKGKDDIGGRTCSGDSGGPVVQNNQLVGIVSAGGECDGDNPGIYTQVSKFIQWIENRM